MAANKNLPAIRFKGFDEEWEEKKLEELSTVKTGFPFDSKTFESDGEYLVITNKNIQHESFSVDNTVGNKVNLYNSNLKEYILNIDDILVTMDGTVGRTAKVIKDKQILAQRVGRLVPKTNADFLYQYLNTGDFFRKMTIVSHGGTIKHISLSEISVYESYAPNNVLEQTRIGNYFNALDGLILLQEQKLEKVTNLKKAMLEKMFPKEGNDVPEIRFKGFTEVWEKKKLGQIGDIVGGGTPSTSNKEFWDGSIDWYSPTEIGDKVYATGSQRRITQLGLQMSSATILPANRTVLFTSRAGIGDMAILKRPGATNQGFQSIVLNDECDTYFVYSMGFLIKKYAIKYSSGSTFLEVSGKILRKMPITIPKPSEQALIGNYFKSLDDLIQLSQQKIERLRHLKQGLLQKMFI